MAVHRVVTGGVSTASYHAHIVLSNIPAHASVSVGSWANQMTIPILTHDKTVRIVVGGTFGSTSGSTTMAIDVGPTVDTSGTFVNLASVSANFTSVYPAQPGYTFRFRHTPASAVAATGASVNVYVG